MPLHDWTDRSGWEGVHHLWIAELFHGIKSRLPAGYRVSIGSAPLVALDMPAQRSDLHERKAASADDLEPDLEIAVAAIDPGAAVFVEREGRLISAIELISPRNKDRPVARSAYLARYLGYLLDSVNLLLVDVHPRPLSFSFADGLAASLQIERPALPPPCAISYRVGEPAATGGRNLAIWGRALAPGERLPSLPLPLTVDQQVVIDLESTYARAAADAYLP